MEAFLMLGIVPGTSIVISFEDWLRLVALITLVLLCLTLLRKQRLAGLLISLAIRTAKPRPLSA